ncbi:MAG: cell division protein FtsQ/DivIB [Endozoicomonas sp. (ex Botrylloides leachii)]|nr:cell division protein FtsQ/DivIB [Endozoicomonas sp. (ex Botrylloides leachii)]
MGSFKNSYSHKQVTSALAKVKKRKKFFSYSVIQWLQVSMALLSLIVVVIIWPKLWLWLDQPITQVNVHAPFIHLNQRQVELLLEDKLKGRFFQLNLVTIRKLLYGQPWVKEVTLKKEWPSKLVIFLEEKEPVARWGDQQLISADGDIFTPESVVEFQQLPMLRGSKRQAQEVMQQYLSISQLLRPMGLVVTGLNLGITGEWSFKLGSVQINIGRNQRMERLQRLVRLYHARLESRWAFVKRIDLRYPNGASVAWDHG